MKKYIRPEAEYIEFYSDVDVTYDILSAQQDVGAEVVPDTTHGDDYWDK